MAARTSPTERQKRLGAEVRKLRTAAGMSIERAAGLLGVDRGKISHFESGVRAISPERVRTLACNCECADRDYVDALVEMAEPRQRGWWERYRGALPSGMLDIDEMEWHAARLVSMNTVHIPGVMQTSEYASAVFRAVVPQLPEHEVALRLANRMERQQILDREDPPECVAYVHEAALRMRFGGLKVARRQLEHVLALAELGKVALRVITVDAGAFPGAGQTVVYAFGPVPQLDTVQIDSTHGPEFLHQDAWLIKYRAQMEWTDRIALDSTDSQEFVRAIINDL